MLRLKTSAFARSKTVKLRDKMAMAKEERISFTVKEIDTMTKIVKGEGSNLEIRESLYNRLSRESGDFLNTASITNKFDDKLTPLIYLLKTIK